MAKPKIFVSHSSLDTEFAVKIADDLNAAGAEVWMDVNDLGAGNFQRGIDEALVRCEWFLLVLTRNALASEWTCDEVYAANRLLKKQKIKGLIFIQAEAEHVEVPALWGVFNIYEGVANYDIALAKTLRDVGVSPAVANPPLAPFYAPAARPVPLMNLERKRPEYPYDKVLHQYVTRGREYLEEEYYAEALAEFDKVLAFLKVDRLRLRKRPQNEKYTLNNLYRKASSGRDDALMGLGRVAEAREARRAVLAGLPYPD